MFYWLHNPLKTIKVEKLHWFLKKRINIITDFSLFKKFSDMLKSVSYSLAKQFIIFDRSLNQILFIGFSKLQVELEAIQILKFCDHILPHNRGWILNFKKQMIGLNVQQNIITALSGRKIVARTYFIKTIFASIFSHSFYST